MTGSWPRPSEHHQVRAYAIPAYRPVRDPMISIIPTDLLWLATGFIMLMAALLAAAESLLND